MSQDSTYDDCNYLYDGGQRLTLLYDHGFGAFFADAVKHPPHAPFPPTARVWPLRCSGSATGAPYIFNGLLVAGLLAFVGYLARGVSPPLRAALMALPLTLPTAISFVQDSGSIRFARCSASPGCIWWPRPGLTGRTARGAR